MGADVAQGRDPLRRAVERRIERGCVDFELAQARPHCRWALATFAGRWALGGDGPSTRVRAGAGSMRAHVLARDGGVGPDPRSGRPGRGEGRRVGQSGAPWRSGSPRPSRGGWDRCSGMSRSPGPPPFWIGAGGSAIAGERRARPVIATCVPRALARRAGRDRRRGYLSSSRGAPRVSRGSRMGLPPKRRIVARSTRRSTVATHSASEGKKAFQRLKPVLAITTVDPFS